MQISISRVKSGYPLYYYPVEVKSFKDLAHHVTNCVWSPIVWKLGKRKTENFSFSDFIGLDFDESLTIDFVTKILKSQNLKYLLGTTKSHQLEKSGKPACDRFRVIIPWKSRVTDFNTYRQNLERLSRMLPGDIACRDGARIFQPCREIHSFSDGVGYEWLPYKAPPPSQFQGNMRFRNNGILPRFIRQMIDCPPGAGARNKHCFELSKVMSKFGFSESDCIRAVMSCAVDLPEREKMTAAKSGFKAGKK